MDTHGIERSKMKEFWKNLKDWQKGGIVVGLLALILVVVIAVIFIINAEPKVEISFAENNNIPGGELKRIRIGLEGTIQNNTENFDKNTIYYGVGRDYIETVEGEITTASFVVDFDEIEESYMVMVTWPDPDDGSPNIVISCALFNGKYPGTPCATESNSSDDLVNYFPYEGLLPSGEKYNILSDYDNEQLYLEIQVNSCGNTAILNEALATTRELISSVNFDPDDYLLYVPGDVCDAELIMDTFPYIQANHAKTNDANVNKNLPYFIPDAYNVYPIVDENNNVVSISAKVPGCYEYQQEPGKNYMAEYLKNAGINYPVTFKECE